MSSLQYKNSILGLYTLCNLSDSVDDTDDDVSVYNLQIGDSEALWDLSAVLLTFEVDDPV